MYQSKNLVSTSGAVRTVEVAPVRPVINAEMIKQRRVGKVKTFIPIIVFFIMFFIMTICVGCSNSNDPDDTLPKDPSSIFTFLKIGNTWTIETKYYHKNGGIDSSQTYTYNIKELREFGTFSSYNNWKGYYAYGYEELPNKQFNIWSCFGKYDTTLFHD